MFYGKVKSLFGMSPIDFVRHMRILRAERLIVESRMSFSEIAYSVGFTDPKYFGRTFKAKTGMTPSDYRKNIRSTADLRCFQPMLVSPL